METWKRIVKQIDETVGPAAVEQLVTEAKSKESLMNSRHVSALERKHHKEMIRYHQAQAQHHNKWMNTNMQIPVKERAHHEKMYNYHADRAEKHNNRLEGWY